MGKAQSKGDQMIDPNKVVVTFGENHKEPIRCGDCLIGKVRDQSNLKVKEVSRYWDEKEG